MIGVYSYPNYTKYLIRHRFWPHASGTENLVFNVWTEPQGIDHSFDANFLRNFIGYLADCTRSDLKPSLFQILLICYDAGTVLTPDFWVPLWFLKVLHHIAAYWIAMRLLGYVPTPELLKSS